MLTKAVLAGLFASAIIGRSALANDGAPADAVIVHTVQCEAGRVGQQLISGGLPANLKVLISWNSTKVANNSFGGVFSFFHLGGSADLGREDIQQLMSTGLEFNLYPDNLAVCNGYKKDIIQEGIGVYDCLINQKLESLRVAVEGGAGSTGCKRQVTISKKVSGNLKLDIWGVDLGPSASWGSSYAFTFQIAAPARKNQIASSE